MVSFQIFGITVTSNYSFATQLLVASNEQAGQTEKTDLTFRVVEKVPSNIHKLEAPHQLSFIGVATYSIWPDHILCHLLDLKYSYLVEIHFLGAVLAYWLELNSIPAMHASAVCHNGKAIAFLSNNKGGKSSLAATFMQIGNDLLSDDILPVEIKDGRILGRPGYPSMRMWPDEASHFLSGLENLVLVHPKYQKRRVPVGANGFGNFCPSPQPLSCFYLPERRDPAEWGAGIEIIPISPQKAIIELIRYSFLARFVEARGLQPVRLGFFAKLVQEVPVKRLIYPNGYTYLPAVREAILQDVEKR